MAARTKAKSASKKKTSAAKPAAKQPAAKKSPARKATPKQAALTRAVSPAPAPTVAPAAQPTAPKGPISASDVNVGHIFALRPAAPTGFKPEAFREARRALADEGYATLEAAARAVAQRALEISRGESAWKPSRGR